jgi:PAS domain S-box-containing protein
MTVNSIDHLDLHCEHAKKVSLFLKWFRQILFAVIILINMVPSTAVSSNEKKRVLVLNSYHEGYSWSDNVMAAIRIEFDKANIDAALFWEDMDTKHYQPEDIFPYLDKLYQVKYRNLSFDVIISSDNNALNFLLTRRDRLFPGVPIVFCGINDYTDALIKGHAEITGVAEDFDMKGTIRLALRLHPGTKFFVTITDSTISAAENLNVFRKAAGEFQNSIEMIELNNLSVSELEQALKKLPGDGVIFHLDYYLDRSGRALTVAESFELINENCNLPVYVNTDNKIGKGALGGVVTSGRLQGEYAAQMAMDILKEKPVQAIPVLKQSPKVPIFDYLRMQQYGIASSELPAGSIVINEPKSFYYKYKALIWITAIFIALLIFVIIFLVISIIHRKRINEALHESEKQYRNLYEEAPHAYFSVGVDGRIKMTNQRAEALLGSSRQDLVQRPVIDLYTDGPAGKEKAQELFKRFQYGGEIQDEEMEMQRADGKLIWVLLTVRPVRDTKGNIVQSRSMVVDVTERKKVDEELKKHHEQLEELVHDRTKEIEKKNQELGQANTRLQEMDRLKSVFLASMSHELRTPLNSIIGFTGIIIMGLSGELNGEQKKQLTMVKDSADHLLGLINDILDISKIEAGKVELEPTRFALKDVIEEVVSLLSPATEEKNLTLMTEIHDDITLFSDKRRLKQILMNLLSNAVKFTNSGDIRIIAELTGNASISDNFDPKQGLDQKTNANRILPIEAKKFIRVSVIDTGAGIKPEDMKRLFMPFQQLDLSLTKKYQGTGLGLNLSQKLVALLGGEIGVKSKYGQGSEFTFTLPIKYKEAP